MSNIVWQSVYLTDDVKINLEYDTHHGLLNIFLKNTDNNNGKWPCHINILSNQRQEYQKSVSNDQINSVSDDEIEILYELSTDYVYDMSDENNIHTDQIDFDQTISSLYASSSCSEDQTFDSDDGYSTHSLDDIEQRQQSSLAIPSSKQILPFYVFNQYNYNVEQCVSSLHRLIEQLTWLSPFRKTIRYMLVNHRY